jgi:hypothetical protein
MMCIIETIMHIIVLERSIKQLYILSAPRLPVAGDADEQAFFKFIDTVTDQSFLHDWVRKCCLHIP